MKNEIPKALKYLGITTHYLRLFFKCIGILYLLFFCVVIYMSCSVHPHYITTPYIYSTKDLRIEQFSEILSLKMNSCGITSIDKPYILDDYRFKEIGRNKCGWESHTRISFQMEVSEYRIGYVVVDCIDSLEIYPSYVNYIGGKDPYENFPELNDNLRMLLYHKPIMTSAEKRLQTILPEIKKIWIFPQQSDLWLLLFAVRPNMLCFFLHFMLIGNFIIMYILKFIEKLLYK